MKTEKANHMPGPWQSDGSTVVAKNRFGEFTTTVGDEFDVGIEKVVVAECGGGNPFHPVNLANARLVAAAPQLLAAVKESLAYLNVPQGWKWAKNQHHVYLLNMLEEAIAAAERD